MCGAKLKRSVVPNSAAIYNFQRAFQLEQEEVSWGHKFGAQTGTNAELPRLWGCQRLLGIRRPGAAT